MSMSVIKFEEDINEQRRDFIIKEEEGEEEENKED